MSIIFLILVIIAFVIIVLAFKEDIVTGFLVSFVSLLILIMPFLMTFRWQISDSTYTGYIYSRESQFGYTTYEIRYSQGAGEDTQPSFTVKAGSEQEEKFDALVGSDKKVIVLVKAGSPKFVNNIFEPSALAELKEV